MSKGNKQLAFWQTVLKIYIKEHRNKLGEDIVKYNSLTEIDIDKIDLSEVNSINTLERLINTRIGFYDILEEYHHSNVQTIADQANYYERLLKSKNIELALERAFNNDLIEHMLNKHNKQLKVA
jgi:hypothetical protein